MDARDDKQSAADTKKSDFENLPNELIQLILSFLPPESIAKTTPTSKKIEKLINDEMLWGKVLKHYFGIQNDKEIERLKSNPSVTNKELFINLYVEYKTQPLIFVLNTETLFDNMDSILNQLNQDKQQIKITNSFKSLEEAQKKLKEISPSRRAAFMAGPVDKTHILIELDPNSFIKRKLNNIDNNNFQHLSLYATNLILLHIGQTITFESIKINYENGNLTRVIDLKSPKPKI